MPVRASLLTTKARSTGARELVLEEISRSDVFRAPSWRQLTISGRVLVCHRGLPASQPLPRETAGHVPRSTTIANLCSALVLLVPMPGSSVPVVVGSRRTLVSAHGWV